MNNVFWVIGSICGLATVINASDAFKGVHVPHTLIAFAISIVCFFLLYKRGQFKTVQMSVPAQAVVEKFEQEIPTGFICSRCFSMNSDKRQKEGGRSSVLFLALLWFTIIGGILYLVLKPPAKNFKKCTSCGAVDSMMSLGSPLGARLWRDNYGNQPNQTSANKQTIN